LPRINKKIKNPITIAIFDSANELIGFVKGRAVYNYKEVFIIELNYNATIKQVKDILLNKKMERCIV